ncbi:YccT family protein [Shewanella surugensis]|uniref:UPF0319 protein L2764_03715 n=1 Tax=Shewanella surugensis TaxID=212020 RepID=A0ABT0L8B7_9GAMM|nr:DUF2057 domain-containing protein [Shewanella surugensis]MCL1123612.1 DUF2057 domain-containing protein [Shewanella surugensis]
MKKLPLFTVLMTLGLCFPALADITLKMPYNSDLVLVNGKDASGNEEVTLPNGPSQIAFRYQGNFYQQGQESLFGSDVIIMTFKGFDSTYSLTLPNLRTMNAAQQFNHKPELTLTDKTGNAVAFEQGKLLKEGLQFGRDFETEIANYNQTNQPAALSSLVAVSNTNNTTSNYPAQTTHSSVTTPPNNQINVGQMLDFWYSQADETTKANFKKRIENNEY